MSIDAQIAGLIEALNANTEALKAVASGKTTTVETKVESADKGETKAAGKKAAAKPETKAEAAKPEHTQAEVNAALIKLKDDFSDAQLAKDIIKKVGGVEKMGEIPADKYDAVFKAAEEKYAELEGGGGDDL